MIDASIRSRHARFLEALAREELVIAEHWHEMRDQALEERHALTEGATVKRRTPPKHRHRERPTRRDFPRAEQPTSEPPYITSHHSGQFEDPGYGSGHGTFGFTHHTNP